MGDWIERRRGVSPVVGVALMVVIVIALATLTASVLVNFESELADPAPVVANEETITVGLQGNDTKHTLEFIHRGGEQVPAEPLQVRVGNTGTTQTVDLTDNTSAVFNDGEWSAGERLQLDLDESAVCGGNSETAEVSLVYAGQETFYRLSDRTVPIERGQFVIEGDSVKATTEFTANVKFLGTGWSSPSYDAPVDVSVRVNGTEVKAWDGIRDSNQTVGSYGISRQDAGTSIAVSARGKESQFGGWRETSESQNSEYLEVLRDGDDVPNYDAGAGQQDVAAYADPFVENGTISLDDNQAIYLFDFNRMGTDHETAEYQDAVILVSFFSQDTETLEVHETQKQAVIICPAETTSASANNN
jgi:flagellin-like protein